MLASELILNSKGHLYHLDLAPEHLADLILVVGDPGRVALLSQRLDSITYQNTHREFTSCLGRSGDTDVLILSTGMGSDNIDIVMNELDALASLHLPSGEPLPKPTKLTIVRVGTSGSLKEDIQPGDMLVSASAVGVDLLGSFYGIPPVWRALSASVESYLQPHGLTGYFTQCDPALIRSFGRGLKKGCTLSLPGFYAPQGRQLRLSAKIPDLMRIYTEMEVDNNPITNIEMETAAYYLLSKHFGHATLSLNAILANRVTGIFHPDPEKVIVKLIDHVFEHISVWSATQVRPSDGGKLPRP
jgi:uridine phosphorylase